MTPEDVPVSITVDQLAPWMQSLELRPFAAPAPVTLRDAAPEDDAASVELRRAA